MKSQTDTTSTEATPRRSYNSTRRAQQAAQTRSDVLAAATRLFTTSGWAGTTVSAIAAEAGVAVETIYSGFGSKKALLRAAMDVAVVGDTDPIPYVERDEFRRLGQGTPSARAKAAAEVVSAIHVRSSGVWKAIMEASAADPEVDAWRSTLERNRRVDVQRSAELIVGRALDERTVDLLWVMFGPEVYLKLTEDTGLSRADYEDYMIDALVRFTATRKRRER